MSETSLRPVLALDTGEVLIKAAVSESATPFLFGFGAGDGEKIKAETPVRREV